MLSRRAYGVLAVTFSCPPDKGIQGVWSWADERHACRHPVRGQRHPPPQEGDLPKGLTVVGTRPLLWHVMSHFRRHGFDDFVVLIGDGGHHIRQYFADTGEPVRLLDAGPDVNSGSRLAQLRELQLDGPFLLSYCDVLTDVDVSGLARAHRRSDSLVTVMAVHPPPRYGELVLDGNRVVRFDEKPDRCDQWINGGIFAIEPEALEVIEGDVDWSREPMATLAAAGVVRSYRHTGFWRPLDTPKDRAELIDAWTRGELPSYEAEFGVTPAAL
ncbi:MAG: sugar phosphate nucleotidyltransferase [Acidimicrobiales bacterium]